MKCQVRSFVTQTLYPNIIVNNNCMNEVVIQVNIYLLLCVLVIRDHIIITIKVFKVSIAMKNCHLKG